MGDLRLAALAEQPWEEVYPGVRRRAVGGERMTFTTYRFAPGGRFPRHSHAQEQLVVALEGAITFSGPAGAVTVRPDHVLVIPPGVPHEAVAGSEGAVVMSVVSPARRGAGDYTVEE